MPDSQENIKKYSLPSGRQEKQFQKLMTTAILTAAGSGSRFYSNQKTKTPKQFLNLLGKPVILYSLNALQKSSFIRQIIIAADKNYFELLHSLLYKFRITKANVLVEGGKTRFDSVKKAFSQINAGVNDLVLIHDAARPNINTNLVDDVLGYAVKYGNTVVGTKITDTIKLQRKGKIIKTIDRELLWTVQTPQVFMYNELKKAYAKNRSNRHTDESSLVESCGFKVNIFEGPKENIKLTDYNDFLLLKKLMS